MDIKEKEDKTNKNFRGWLNKHEIPYLYIDQEINTFSVALKKHTIRRPDFIIFIRNIGWFMVDVEYKRPAVKYAQFQIDLEETHKYIQFQENYNIHIWYVFGSELDHFHTWYWIPVSKVTESTTYKKQYFGVSLKHFAAVTENHGIGKLLTEMSKFF